MPEHLFPGVHVEETTFPSRSIEGVPTSTLGMVGTTEYGPVAHPSNDGKRVRGPVLLTSMTEYERVYGGLTNRAMPCRLALAARAFFANGGRRLYVQRVFVPAPVRSGRGSDDDLARIDLPVGANGHVVRWRARWPGAAGSHLRVVTRFRRSDNILVGTQLQGLAPGAAVETAALAGGQALVLPDGQAPANLQVVTHMLGMLCLRDGAGGVTAPGPDQAAFHVTLDVEVHFGDRIDVYRGLELGAEHPRFIKAVLHDTEPADENSLVWLDDAEPANASPPTAAALLAALVSPGEQGVRLIGGSDGDELTPSALQGHTADSDTSSAATGLAALSEIDDIAIVAMPDSTYFQDQERAAEAVDALIAHCEGDRYRFALIDPPENGSVSEVRAFHARFDSAFAAMYYPWLRISDPTLGQDPGAPPTLLDVPPSGAVAGIFARSDIERGVHTAPTNQVVHGTIELVTHIDGGEREVLSHDGVNTLRFFEGRGNVLWGARTISSDPKWAYVNVRRLLIYLEQSIEKSTQWAVFEPNDPSLWGTVRRTIEDFLTAIWRTDALTGTTPEEAFFVRCDRTTMTQNDLDNGRLVCLVGIAPRRPAEFVILRIDQWTADPKG
ncbi:MAG: phage tail sheath subtilisin-like domain-containing protein [Ornithinibacter sp.]